MNAVTNSSGQSNDLAKEELVMLLTSISALTSATASPSANSGTSGVGVGARFGSGEPQAIATSMRSATAKYMARIVAVRLLIQIQVLRTC